MRNIWGGMSLCSYVLRRLVSLIPILLGVTLLTYGLMYISPQDPVEMMLQGQGTAPKPEVVEAMRHQLGLDRPFLVQYLDWLWRFVLRGHGRFLHRRRCGVRKAADRHFRIR